tara:strand:+ start:340 stop:1821 length:1482 start_codon:yes stop_codon:yes gene_type:complete
MDQNNGGILGKINTPTTTVASGVWSLDSQFEAQTSSIWPLAFPQTTFTNTCRFDDGSSDYLTKTFSSAGNRKTWTWSGWVKRCTLGAQQDLLSVSSGSSAYHLWYIDSNDGVTHNYNGTYVSSAPKFRDVSAWYHFVCAVDTTQSTAADRVKMYVNGSQITSFDAAGYPSQDADLSINNNVRHDISNGGAHFSNNFYLDGYMAEVVFVDGQALTPTSFGATNPITNIWEPIAYAGTYGTNGFKLNFADSSNLGDDTSGNTNDFTVNNLTSIDQSTDTPSNNFATGNSLYRFNSGVTISEGNLQLYVAAGWRSLISTIGVSTGKWYAEVKFVSVHSGGNNAKAGIVALDGTVDEDVAQAHVGGSSTGNNYGYENDATIDSNGSNASYGSTFTAGDIIGVAMDLDNNKLYFSKNGTFQNSGDPTSGSTGTGAISINSDTYGICASGYYGTMALNYGSPPYAVSSGNADANGHGNFEYAVPSGYFALNTKNLSEFG